MSMWPTVWMQLLISDFARRHHEFELCFADLAMTQIDMIAAPTALKVCAELRCVSLVPGNDGRDGIQVQCNQDNSEYALIS